jgi:hypothetical protein
MDPRSERHIGIAMIGGAALVCAGVGCSGAQLGGGNVCEQLNASYAAAVPAELVCTPGAPYQCQALVATSPTECTDDACGAQLYVNDNTTTEMIRGQWLRTCDPNGIHSCPVYTCDPPAPTAACVSDGPGATTGTCVPTSRGGGAGILVDGGESCDQLAADYTAAVNAARVCTPGAPGQCQINVNTAPSTCTPDQCDATGWVSDATAIDAAQARWLAQCGVIEGCLGIICIPQSVSCVPNASGDAGTATGLCTATFASATP